MSCKAFASTEVKFEDRTLFRNDLWRSAALSQFPNKFRLDFLGDIENWLVAKTKELCIFVNFSECQTSGIHENHPILDEIYSFNFMPIIMPSDSSDRITFVMKDRFLLIQKTVYKVVLHGQFTTSKEASRMRRKIMKTFTGVYPTKFVIFDCAKSHLTFWNPYVERSLYITNMDEFVTYD
jgi:hypothetical protein